MFYLQECKYIIVSLNTEILEKPWKFIKVTPFHSNLQDYNKFKAQFTLTE